jgi:uncharacterized protein (DUF1499 family)
MKVFIGVISLLAVALGLMIVLAGPGTRFEYWDYSTGLDMMFKAARPITIIDGVVSLSPVFTAAGLALAGGVIAFFLGAGRLGMFAVLAAVFAGSAGMIPMKMRDLVSSNPFIHEITTDFNNPPPILAAADLPRKNPPDYKGDEQIRDTGQTVAEAQRQAFPDIQPKLVVGTVDENAEIVLRVIEAMDMEILSNAPTDQGWLIEAAYTSRWFGFVDDFVVRLRQEGAMTRIDVRSKSRVGGSDLGANARRVQTFLEKLDAATS